MLVVCFLCFLMGKKKSVIVALQSVSPFTLVHRACLFYKTLFNDLIVNESAPSPEGRQQILSANRLLAIHKFIE